MEYTIIPVSKSLWGGIIRLYITHPSYIHFCHSYRIYYQTSFEILMGGYYKIIHYLSRLHSFFLSVRVVTKYTDLDKIVDHMEHYLQFYTLRAVCSDTRAVELGINWFV